MGFTTGFAGKWIGDAAGRLVGTGVAARLKEMLPGSLPEPSFHNFSHGKNKSRLFEEFHFSRRLTDYVMDEPLWRKFEAFYRDPQPLSWWLLTGPSGSGKSRTALEFCRVLATGKADFIFADGQSPAGIKPVAGENFSYWKTGFLNLADTPFSVWETWRPRRHTLLVFDQMSRHYGKEARSGMAGGQGGQDGGESPRMCFNLAEIIRCLSRKAKNGDFGSFRVRLLLLERETREKGIGGGQRLEWARELRPYRSLSFGKRPTPLPPLTAAGLYGLAQDIWGKTEADASGAPNVPSEVFLEKLAAIDSKRRPLFAMLLAACASADAGLDVTRGEVLDLAFRYGLDRVLQYAGAEDAPQVVRALAMSTLTGGRLGACELPNGHPLWKSGLGQAVEGEEGIFLFDPIEPELLGEHFILEGMGQGDLSEPLRIDSGEMRGLAAKVWEIYPPETADFFTRCGQDFFASPDWVACFLNSRLAELDAPRYVRTLMAVIARLGGGQAKAAREIYDHLTELGAAGIFCRERAKVAAELIRIYCNAGMFDEASPVFLGMGALGDSEEVRMFRAEASAYLIDGLCKVGELVRARVMFEGALAFEAEEGVLLPKARALVSLINSYGKSGNIFEAQTLFSSLTGCGDSEAVRAQRAKASVSMIVLYGKAGNLEEACEIYECMQALGQGAEVLEAHAKAFKFLDFFTAAAKKRPEDEPQEDGLKEAASA